MLKGKIRIWKFRQNSFICLVASLYSQNFFNSHVQMWEMDHQGGWAPKNWCFWIAMLEKTHESPLDCKIKSISPKGNQPWMFTGWTDAEAEAPVLWLPDAKSWLIGKDSDAREGWRQKEKRGQRMRWLDSITDSMHMSLSKLWEIVKNRKAWHAVICRVTKSQAWLSNWATSWITYMSLLWSQSYYSNPEIDQESASVWG